MKFLILASFALAASAAQAATTIFSHNFNEGTTSLSGQAVDGGTGAPQNWVSAGVVTRNGVFSTGSGSATLAFQPTNGFEYTLDARILDVAGNGNWVALGFANNQNTGATANDRFTTNNVVGTAWMLFRGNNDINSNTTFLGSGATTPINQGILNQAAWPNLNNSGGSIDLRILLNTTGGDGNWTVTWLGKLIADTNYTVLRNTHPTIALADQARYTSVGFAFSNADTNGTIETFSLTAIPEPSAALLGGLGLLALLRRRR